MMDPLATGDIGEHAPRGVRHPAVRASAVQDSLAFLDTFEPGAQARVLDLVPRASREIIETTPRSSWISIEHDHWTIDAMIEIWGRKRAIEGWRDGLTQLVERPLLRAFVSGMVNVIGPGDPRIVGVFTKGWPLVYRDMCQPRLVTLAEGRLGIRFENVAPEVRLYKNYFDSLDGACQGFARIAQLRGPVAFDVGPDMKWAECAFLLK